MEDIWILVAFSYNILQEKYLRNTTGSDSLVAAFSFLSGVKKVSVNSRKISGFASRFATYFLRSAHNQQMFSPPQDILGLKFL